MKRYTLPRAAWLLGIDLSTLWRWRHAARMDSFPPGQRAFLTRAQVAQLARAHGRILIDDERQGARHPSLEDRVAALEREVEELRGCVESL